MYPGSARAHQESANPCAALSEARGGKGHSGPARSVDDRGTTRPRVLLLPLQYRRAYPGALDVCPQAIRFDSPACVRLYGKGRKERLSPLWPETLSLLRSQLQRQPRPDDEPIFVNRYGVPLGASGVRFKLAQCIEAATKVAPNLASKRVTPHSFRHATAVHLVAAGVDITVIRSWLGHVSLDTTNHYAQANLETKRLALERLESPSRSGKRPSWKQDRSVLAWLDTL